MEFSANIDSSIIQQIADALGLAVDQTARYLDQYLPAYAQLKTMQMITPAIVAGIILIVFAVVAIIALCMAREHMRVDMTTEDRLSQKYCQMTRIHGYGIDECCYYISWWIGIIALIIAAIAFVNILFFIARDVPLIITWMNAPEAMLLDTIINAAV